MQTGCDRPSRSSRRRTTGGRRSAGVLRLRSASAAAPQTVPPPPPGTLRGRPNSPSHHLRRAPASKALEHRVGIPPPTGEPEFERGAKDPQAIGYAAAEVDRGRLRKIAGRARDLADPEAAIDN